MDVFRDLPITPIRNTSVLRRQRRIKNDPWGKICKAQSQEDHMADERKKLMERQKVASYAEDLRKQIEARQCRSLADKLEDERLGNDTKQVKLCRS